MPGEGILAHNKAIINRTLRSVIVAVGGRDAKRQYLAPRHLRNTESNILREGILAHSAIAVSRLLGNTPPLGRQPTAYFLTPPGSEWHCGSCS
jgi:hypothetical protein